MAGNDYERASQQLSQIPADLRNNAVNDLQAEADDLVEEVRRLSDDVAHAVKSGIHDEMLPTVERLLELKPQHRQENDLYEQLLNAQRAVRSSRRSSSREKSKSASTIDPKLIGGAAAAVVLLICLFVFWPNSDAVSDSKTVVDAGAASSGSVDASHDGEAVAVSTATPSARLGSDEIDAADARQPIRDFLKDDRRRTPE